MRLIYGFLQLTATRGPPKSMDFRTPPPVAGSSRKRWRPETPQVARESKSGTLSGRLGKTEREREQDKYYESETVCGTEVFMHKPSLWKTNVEVHMMQLLS